MKNKGDLFLDVLILTVLGASVVAIFSFFAFLFKKSPSIAFETIGIITVFLLVSFIVGLLLNKIFKFEEIEGDE